MTQSGPRVVPIFATPLGLAALPEAGELNPAVAALLSARATPERADPASRPPVMYHSRDDLLQWPEEPVRRLTKGIIGAALSLVRTVNDMTDAQFGMLQLQARAWFTIVRPDGCVPSDNHPNAAWCGVYCVAAPQPSQTRLDSGVLRLHEAIRTTMFADATNSVMHAPFNTGHGTWRPTAGHLAVFPAPLMHEVALLRGEGELILITTLLRFIAPGQTGMPWW